MIIIFINEVEVVQLRMYYICFFQVILTCGLSGKQSVVVSSGSKGRLGDKIMELAKGQWCAWRAGLPFFYASFLNSDKLSLSRLIQPSSIINASKFSSVRVDDEEKIKADQDDIIWTTNFYTKISGYAHLQELKESHLENVLLHALDDVLFGKRMQQLLLPLSPVQYAIAEKGIPVIGVHYRFGSGGDSSLVSTQQYSTKFTYGYKMYDHPGLISRVCDYSAIAPGTCWGADNTWPTKFPPLQYYLDQLLFACQLCKRPPLILLCTDCPQAAKIAKKMKLFLQSAHTRFKGVEVVQEGLLGDMYVLATCNILIRGNSNFARASQLMGNHAMIIRPFRFDWVGKELHISKVAVDVRSNIIEDFIDASQLIAACARAYTQHLSS